MPLPFSGSARKLSANDIVDVVKSLGCEVAALQAVVTVETGGAGGFLADGSGRPRILFEAEAFGKATEGVYNASHPDISSPIWNRTLYKGGAAEYDRLNAAVALNREAAVSSASWGMFQVMGFNFRLCGYGDVDEMVAAMCEDEREHLQAFAAYVVNAGLKQALVERDWDTFAKGYNGPGYKLNNYASRLQAAYALNCGATPTPIRIGVKSATVAVMQRSLNNFGAHLTVDSQFGRTTELALMAFQDHAGIPATGMLDPVTAYALKVKLP